MEYDNSNTQIRKWKQLSERDRYQIEGYFQAGLKTGEIAELIGCSKRTIERERKLGLTEQMKKATADIISKGEMQIQNVYLADTAQRKHEENSANKGRCLKIGKDHRLVKHIEGKIREERWSPAAVIGDIKAKGMKFDVSICIKTLYNYIERDLFLGISNKDLLYKKKPRKRSEKRVRTVALNNRSGKSIEERSEGAGNREEQGHWEIDLVIGKKNSKPAILTMVERKTRKSIYVYVKDKTQGEIIKGIKKARSKVKGDFGEVFKTITADNGPEFLDGRGIKKASGCKEIYYTHPYSSWEKGSNENGNRILRRFLPKGTDFSKITKEEVQRIEDWVNNYPRKIFGYRTANDMYTEIL